MNDTLETVGVEDASRILRISPDALMRKARAGFVPGAKIGRRWVFVRADLIEFIRSQARARAARSIAHVRVSTAGPASAGRARLDEHFARVTALRRKLAAS